MSDQNASNTQMLRNLEKALDAALTAEGEATRRRVERAQEATARASLFAGFSDKPAFADTIAARAKTLETRSIDLGNELSGELVKKVRSLAAPQDKDTSRVYGQVVVKPDFKGKVVLTDDSGATIGEAPLDSLGHFVLVTDAEAEKGFLEVRDLQDQVVHLEGTEITLKKGDVVERSFALKDGGRLKPSDPVDPGPPELPDLTGLQIDEARKVLAELGEFRISVTGAHSDAPEDTITGQVPAPGELLKPGALILLTVSLGQEKQTPMPELEGLSEREVRRILADLTFRSVSFEKKVDPDRAGQILDQKPPAGDPVGNGTDIVLVIAVKQQRSPDVLGLPQDQAVERLASTFAEAPVIKTKPHDGPAGIVLHQSPASGRPVTGKITLTISAPRKKGAGTAGATSKMPNLKGKTRAAALKALKTLGIDKPKFDAAAAKRRGHLVTGQSPKPGTTLKDGQKVSLKFGDGK